MTRREPDRPDPYELAHSRAERRRRGRSAPVDPDAPAPGLDIPLPPKPKLVWILGAVAVLLAIGIARNAARSHPPALRTDCAHPALALSKASPATGTLVRWSATGPRDERIVLAVGSDRLEPTADGKLRVVPPAGKTDKDVQPASHGVQLSGCKADGFFALTVPAGHYDVRMFRVTGTGPAVTATPIASTPIEVVAR